MGTTLKGLYTDYKIQSRILLHVRASAETQRLRLFVLCVEHVRALQACGPAASLWRAAC